MFGKLMAAMSGNDTTKEDREILDYDPKSCIEVLRRVDTNLAVVDNSVIAGSIVTTIPEAGVRDHRGVSYSGRPMRVMARKKYKGVEALRVITVDSDGEVVAFFVPTYLLCAYDSYVHEPIQAECVKKRKAELAEEAGNNRLTRAIRALSSLRQDDAPVATHERIKSLLDDLLTFASSVEREQGKSVPDVPVPTRKH